MFCYIADKYKQVLKDILQKKIYISNLMNACQKYMVWIKPHLFFNFSSLIKKSMVVLINKSMES